jgi:hypothetical protein
MSTTTATLEPPVPEYMGLERRRRTRPPAEQRTEKLEVYVTEEFAEKFRQAVGAEGNTVSHVLRQLARQYLKARGITAL